MNSKTPKFDEAIGKILDDLRPHTRQCRECQNNFDIVAEDIEFYKKFKVPAPTLCPQCRMQRRLAHRVILPIFYKKTCSAPGHQEKIISFYSEKNPIKIYDDKYYISDQWEASNYQKKYQDNQNFFQQFHNFKLSIPHQASSRDLNSINCDYTVSGNNSKDCYYSATTIDSEHVNFSVITVNSKFCYDVADVDNSENCYDSIYLNNCYQVKYSRESSHCLNSAFLFDCRDCSDCFMSSNLRHKKYYFYNQQLSKETYLKKIKQINLGNRIVVKKLKKDYQNMLLKKAIHKNVNNEKINNSVGNLLREVNNCYWAVRVFGGSENLRYVSNGHGLKDVMDVFGAIKVSRCYESTGIGVDNDNLKFSIMIRGGSNLEYCTDCVNCSDCFACVGLKDKKFHIFNRKYQEEEYWQEIDRIKTSMLSKGEYGEFFPIKKSIHPYQDSVASTEYSLDERVVKEKGWHQAEEVESDLDLSKIKIINGENIPADISQVDKSIFQKAIICSQTAKPFKITSFEFDFYKKHNIPLPTIHPLERIKTRDKQKYNFTLYQDYCFRCKRKIISAHNPDRKLKVYCEKCYNEEVA